jgi:FdhE protein
VKQGLGAPKGKWQGSPQGGVTTPDAIILPNPATRFVRTAERLETLATGHPMQDWLRVMATLARAQHAAATAKDDVAPAGGAVVEHTVVELAVVEQAVRAGMPPLAADGHRRQPVWRAGLARLLDHAGAESVSPQARAVQLSLRERDAASVEVLADGFLLGGVDQADAGAALYVAAALQVYFTRLAAALPVESLQLLPQRGLCPSCGSTPVAGVVTASGQSPGTRYLYCSLCSTAWNHVRAACTGCGQSRDVALQEVEGGNGAIKAETCDGCHGYAKMFYQAKDTAVEPFADDLASLGLDLMVSEAGWSRLAPNPFVLA